LPGSTIRCISPVTDFFAKVISEGFLAPVLVWTLCTSYKKASEDIQIDASACQACAMSSGIGASNANNSPVAGWTKDSFVACRA